MSTAPATTAVGEISAQDFADYMQLWGEYQFAMDEGDPDKIIQVFTEDAYWGGGVHADTGGARGREEIRALMQRRKDTLDALHPGKPIYEFRRHHVTNPMLVEVNGDEAKFQAYFFGTLRRGNHFDTVITGYYHGTIVRVDGRWRFKERYCIPDLPNSGWWPPTEWA
jgi:SnoaL-like domain